LDRGNPGVWEEGTFSALRRSPGSRSEESLGPDVPVWFNSLGIIANGWLDFVDVDVNVNVNVNVVTTCQLRGQYHRNVCSIAATAVSFSGDVSIDVLCCAV